MSSSGSGSGGISRAEGEYINKEVKKLDINSPVSNYFRIYKQCLLVEEHIATKENNCRFCTWKHLSTIEALLDEVVQLDGRGIYASYNDSLLEVIKPLKFAMTSRRSGPTDEEYREVMMKVRSVRKKISSSFFFAPPVSKNPTNIGR